MYTCVKIPTNYQRNFLTLNKKIECVVSLV